MIVGYTLKIFHYECVGCTEDLFGLNRKLFFVVAVA